MKLIKYVIFIICLIQCSIKAMEADIVDQLIEDEYIKRKTIEQLRKENEKKLNWLPAVIEEDQIVEDYDEPMEKEEKSDKKRLSTTAGEHRFLKKFEQKRWSLSQPPAKKPIRFSHQLKNYKDLIEFNRLGSYDPEDFNDYNDYVEKYREPVKQLLTKLDITQTEDNDPLFMAISMNDSDFLMYLLEKKADPKFKSLKHFSGYDLLTSLEDFDRTRAAYNLSLDDIKILKKIMMEYRPDVFSFEELTSKGGRKSFKSPVKVGRFLWN